MAEKQSDNQDRAEEATRVADQVRKPRPARHGDPWVARDPITLQSQDRKSVV